MFFLLCILGQEVDYQKLIDKISSNPNSKWKAKMPKKFYKPMPLNVMNQIKYELKKLR